MLSDYLTAAARHATYEMLPEDGVFYGEIPPCAGVHATGTTLEDCRAALLSALEDWILFRIHRHLSLPVIDGVELSVKAEAAI
ncbi:MAG: type II toxin-antitoxin system HicB family antitoxin [Planctomycetia bacterium]|jgi:predicted RNase H-like HicB family nuclease